MIYTPKHSPGQDEIIISITYGSRLYGTETPESDYDFKSITLPSYKNTLLAKPLKVTRYKYDEAGNVIAEGVPVPARGYEAEHTPIQKFIKDYLSGQAYAVEIAYAVMQGYHYTNSAINFQSLCASLVYKFQHQNVQGMVGFAVKQTFDYVRRGERLNAAKALLSALDKIIADEKECTRLDSIMSTGSTVLYYLAGSCSLPTGITVNASKELQTIEINGRSYAESTALPHFKAAVEKLILQYGERSTAASETDVDWKSLSHAVRVYEQVIELLNTSWITFPRPNAEQLLRFKQGKVSLEAVKFHLRTLDDEVQRLLAITELPVVDAEFYKRADDLLFSWLQEEFKDE
jgi:hypothetical protein